MLLSSRGISDLHSTSIIVLFVLVFAISVSGRPEEEKVSSLPPSGDAAEAIVAPGHFSAQKNFVGKINEIQSLVSIATHASVKKVVTRSR
jgi:hypothetical protein